MELPEVIACDCTLPQLLGWWDDIVSDCDVCGRLLFNAQSYMCKNDAYFTSTLHWIWISWIRYSSTPIFKVAAFPLPMSTMSICMIHWVFYGYITTVLHIYYLSWRIS